MPETTVQSHAAVDPPLETPIEKLRVSGYAVTFKDFTDYRKKGDRTIFTWIGEFLVFFLVYTGTTSDFSMVKEALL